MTDEKRDWRNNAAATLDLLGKQWAAIHEVTVTAYALRRALEEGNPQFQAKFARHYAALETELSAAKDSFLHILEKNAGQLRGDPFWRD